MIGRIGHPLVLDALRQAVDQDDAFEVHTAASPSEGREALRRLELKLTLSYAGFLMLAGAYGAAVAITLQLSRSTRAR